MGLIHVPKVHRSLMNLSQETLLKLLSRDTFSSFKLESDDIDFLKPSEVASLYIYVALLVTIMGYIKEQLWLYKNENLDLLIDILMYSLSFVTMLCKHSMRDIHISIFITGISFYHRDLTPL